MTAVRPRSGAAVLAVATSLLLVVPASAALGVPSWAIPPHAADRAPAALRPTASSVGGLTVLATAYVGTTAYLATWNATGGEGSGNVYVANEGSGSVSILNATTTIATVDVSADGIGPYEPIDDPAAPSIVLTYHAYGVHGASHNVSVLYGPVAGGNQAVSNVGGITAGDEPGLGVYDVSTGDVYLSDEGTTVGVAVVNASNETRFATVPTGAGSEPGDLAVAPPSGWVYVADLGTSNISVVKGTALLTTLKVPALADSSRVSLNATGEVFVPDYSSDLAYDPINGEMYVADAGAAEVSVLNGTRLVANVSVGKFPYSVAYDPGDGDVYVTNVLSSSVSILRNSSVVGTVAVGQFPLDAVYDAYDGDVLVANLNSSNVSVLSGRAVVGSVTVGTDPVYGIYDTINGRAYIIDQGSHTVTILGPQRGGASGIPPWGWGLILIVLVLLIAALLVAVHRRRGRRKAPGSGPVPTARATPKETAAGPGPPRAPGPPSPP